MSIKLLLQSSSNHPQECNEYQSEYGAPQKTVCRTWFESECNTTYVQAATVLSCHRYSLSVSLESMCITTYLLYKLYGQIIVIIIHEVDL